jgi:hypothetical protein
MATKQTSLPMPQQSGLRALFVSLEKVGPHAMLAAQCSPSEATLRCGAGLEEPGPT